MYRISAVKIVETITNAITKIAANPIASSSSSVSEVGDVSSLSIAIRNQSPDGNSF